MVGNACCQRNSGCDSKTDRAVSGGQFTDPVAGGKSRRGVSASRQYPPQFQRIAECCATGGVVENAPGVDAIDSRHL